MATEALNKPVTDIVLSLVTQVQVPSQSCLEGALYAVCGIIKKRAGEYVAIICSSPLQIARQSFATQCELFALPVADCVKKDVVQPDHYSLLCREVISMEEMKGVYLGSLRFA